MLWGRFQLTSNWHLNSQLPIDEWRPTTKPGIMISIGDIALPGRKGKVVGMLEAEDRNRSDPLVFGCFFSTYIRFTHTHTQNNNVVKMDCPISVSCKLYWENLHIFDTFPVKCHFNLDEPWGLETCGNPGHGNGPGPTLGAYGWHHSPMGSW